MPAFETMDLNEDAVLWVAVGSDRDGEPTVADAGEDIVCRFVLKKQQSVDPKGNITSIDGTMVTDREVPVNSVVWAGTLADLPGTNPNPPASNTLWVVTSDATLDIKGRNQRTTCGLKFFKDSLPSTT